ncbi:MAG TPA: DedA family protein, partial [Candidatus Polarisedimenticolia bacterium]|nr:DedA family protein [Candidatus Polarisedimenticolia bacterium]
MDELARQLARHGLQLVFLNVLLEQAGLPIPSMPVLVLCGALAARGEMSVTLVLLTATIASLMADMVWFFLGRRRGRRILKTICHISLSPDSCVRQTEDLFHRYGLYSIAVAKFIPGFSTVAPPLAGAMRVGL